MRGWFSSWKALGFPMFFIDRYNKSYDEWLNNIIENGVIYDVTKYQIHFKNPENKNLKYAVWIENKMFGYATPSTIFIGEFEEINIFDNVRPSIKTMAKLYDLEQTYRRKRVLGL